RIVDAAADLFEAGIPGCRAFAQLGAAETALQVGDQRLARVVDQDRADAAFADSDEQQAERAFADRVAQDRMGLHGSVIVAELAAPLTAASLSNEAATDEDRDLQRQRHQCATAAPARMAGRVRTGRRLPAGTQ